MLSTRKQQHENAGYVDTMRVLTDAENARLKRMLLTMGTDILSVCEKHGLSVMLCGGSALGAARHKGYIPWDDDLDLCLPRADFETLKRVFREELSDRYLLHAPNAGDAPITNAFMKVIKKGTRLEELMTRRAPGTHGIFVDVFPLDYAPDSPILRKIKGFIANGLAFIAVSNYLYRFRDEDTRAFFAATKRGARVYRARLMIGRLFCAFPYRALYNAYDRFIRGKPSRTLTIAAGRGHYLREALPKVVFLPPRACAFEGKTMFLPADADRYLTNLYGDYQTVPPPEKRERHYFTDIDFGQEE